MLGLEKVLGPSEQLAMRPVYASDIYSLGATCIYLLTGKNPQELSDRKTGELKWEQYTRVSSHFAKVLNKMLDLDLKKRYNSAREVIQALEIIPYQKKLEDAIKKRRQRKNKYTLVSVASKSTNVN